MGNGLSKENKTSKANKSNGKTVEIKAEICAVCDYEAIKGIIKDILIKNLNEKGYNVNYTLIPSKQGKGEFFIFKIEDGKEIPVFSNSAKIHGSTDAIIDGLINLKNVEKISNLIIN